MFWAFDACIPLGLCLALVVLEDGFLVLWFLFRWWVDWYGGAQRVQVLDKAELMAADRVDELKVRVNSFAVDHVNRTEGLFRVEGLRRQRPDGCPQSTAAIAALLPLCSCCSSCLSCSL